jgi:hypothetical protein
MRTYRQGTNEKRLYQIDLSQEVGQDDEISTVAWTVDNGITTSGSVAHPLCVDIEAEGGTEGTSYTFQAVATTQKGRKLERSFIVQVVDR